MKSEKRKICLVATVEGKEQNFTISTEVPQTSFCSRYYDVDSFDFALKVMQHIEENSMLIPGIPWELTLENVEFYAAKAGFDLETVYSDALECFDLYWYEHGYDDLREELEARLPLFILQSQRELMDLFYLNLNDNLADWLDAAAGQILTEWKMREKELEDAAKGDDFLCC